MKLKELNERALEIFKKDIFSSKALLVSFIAIGLIFFLKWFILIDIYSVNVLYYDLWDLYGIFFNKYSLTDLYILQHGPHRQGIGFILTSYIDELSGWNTKWISITIGILTASSSVIYLIIKKKYFDKITLIDVIIIVLIVTPTQYGVFANTPNISHGAMPVFLISLFFLALFIKNFRLKIIMLVLLNFLIIYSAFGLLFGFISPIILLIILIKNRDNKKAFIDATIGLISIILSILLFFYNYKHSPANPDFHFPHDKPLEYLIFIAKMTKSAIGIPKGVGDVLTYLVFIFQLYILTDQFKLVFRRESKDLNLLIIGLISFSLLFEIATAVGRVSFGTHVASSSRYVIYVIPGLIGTYFYFISRFNLHVFQIIVIGAFSIYTILNNEYMPTLKRFKESKEKWVEVYKKTENIDSANEATAIPIYPGDYTMTRLNWKLNYLKENKLNLYSED